ncbi:nucleoside hydrolase [Mesorhizobium sp. IMUNJ 23232]|uniref:nucleoside hydrolase n=1 Tax=Mesorhizobium sp. IMUNJ 23232 TaxID=3376064 RepID=UPI003790FCB2
MSRITIIDTDPGIDDAVAILLALVSPKFDIAGVTTVAGNIGIKTVTRNAGRILALAGRGDIPVIPGAAAPLSRKGFDTADIHGRDGLGGVAFPEPVSDPLAGPAWTWIADMLDRHPEGTVDILALGPLTNIAKLVRERPQSACRIGRLIAMGGAVHERGNVGPRAEFNIADDPEAADIVFRAGLPLVLIPLDVTRRVRATKADTALLRGSGAPAGKASADLVDAYFQSTGSGESRPLHDPCVMLIAMRPDLFGLSPLTLAVDTGYGEDAGALSLVGEGAAVSVAMKVQGPEALAVLIDRLGGSGG